ncbi:MAG: NAD(P)/FAD-dependent oxidoreductase [Planctomycetota bacterium]|jgi:2-polyprenyl-6-methoxyphenol hydroxylase-like FAD-dependent oxidoreductase
MGPPDPPPTFDAVVVGGGPAGAMSARALARRGWRTALVERRPRGRGKACGHCLNARGLGALARAGLLGDVRRIAAGATGRIRIRAVAAAAETVADLPGGLVVPRRRLDAVLLDAAAAAGVHVLRPASVASIRWRGDRARVALRAGSRPVLETRLVVGADGLGSAVARAAGLAPRRIGRRYGFAYDVRPAGAPVAGPGEIVMLVGPGGYLGVVGETDGRQHVGALVDAAAPARDPGGFVRALGARLGPAVAGLAPVRGGVVDAAGPMPWRPRRVAGHGVVLVGDAAGYVEPFTGEGMAWALAGAEVLDEVLAGARPGAWSSADGRRYEAAWRRRIGRPQLACRLVGWTVRRPALAAAAARPPLVRRVAARVLAA